jgi:hypothetical protein
MQLKTLYPCTFILNCNSALNPERESLTLTLFCILYVLLSGQSYWQRLIIKDQRAIAQIIFRWL